MSTNFKTLIDRFISDYQDSFSIKHLSLIHQSSYSSVYKASMNEMWVCIKIQTGALGKDIIKSQVEQLLYLKKHRIDSPTVLNCIEHYDIGIILITEFIDSEAIHSDQGQYNLGYAIAQMHQIKHTQFGWEKDNFIGSCSQPNKFTDNWIEFLLENRYLYQIQLARNNNMLDSKSQIEYADTVISFLERQDTDFEPSLLHGDLWNGNYIIQKESNRAFLIDPAIYFGHSSMDMAMTHLFGGFSKTFYDAYYSIIPKKYEDNLWANFYILCYLLVHLNMFGKQYLRPINRTIRLLER
jgi:protein-ribulosamine 3-kinase